MNSLKQNIKRLGLKIIDWITSNKYVYYRFCDLYDQTILSGKILIKPRNLQGKYFLYAKSHIAARLLLSTYENETISILNKFQKISGTIVNIGANIGLICIHIGLSFENINNIIAFEPNKEAFDLLKLNISINNLDKKINIVNASVGNTTGSIELFSTPEISEYSSIGGKIIHPAVGKLNQISYIVDIYKLDDLDIDNISLMIIDTEGAEYLVLEGAKTTLEKNHPIILFECEDKLLIKFGHSSLDIFKLLSSYGYYLYDIEKRKKLKISKDFNGEVLAIHPENNYNLKSILANFG
uniref:FkbM family methyltransferase n=1 Tax=Ignavibacterium album TaxID=591197 RepID=A0A7V2ZK71_9BACT